MKTRVLGRSGLAVGAIGFGCMGMSWAYGPGDGADDPIQVIHRAIDLGATLIDTADMYGPFKNEELVGKALRGRRDEVVLATKGGYVVRGVEPISLAPNGSPEHLAAACDASLARLGVEYVDLYYLHRPDPQVAIEESVGALARMVEQGKVRAIGLSECDVPTLDRAQRVHPITALQSEFSLWTREPLAEILPWCVRNDVAFVAFSPLSRGFLTGAQKPGTTFSRADFRSGLPRFQSAAFETNLALVAQLEAIAASLNATVAQVALAWVLAQGDQVIPIPGTRRLSRLEENCAAADVTLSPADLAAINALPAPVGARY